MKAYMNENVGLPVGKPLLTEVSPQLQGKLACRRLWHANGVLYVLHVKLLDDTR